LVLEALKDKILTQVLLVTIGPRGPVGVTPGIGAIGPIGPRGPVGVTPGIGAIGPIGPIGPINGSEPFQGPIGPRGPVGVTPGIGAIGPKGVQGVIGPVEESSILVLEALKVQEEVLVPEEVSVLEVLKEVI
jgi:hypothetical protein